MIQTPNVDLWLPETSLESAQPREYLPLKLNALVFDMTLDCQIFLKMGPGQFVKYREPGFPFNREARQRLLESNHPQIFFHASDRQHLNNYLEANLRYVIASADIPEIKKAETLYTTTVRLVRDLIESPNSSEDVKRCKLVAEQAVDFIFSYANSLAYIMDLSSTDYYTYTHCVHVMTYSIALAKKLGYAPGTELSEIGQGALLHDVGKSYINPLIMNKEGSLTRDEFEEMKKHTEYGFNALKESGEVGDRTLYTVRYHHEKLDGKGYPAGLKANQIDEVIRIISTCDIYDALTTRRVYRKAYNSFPALKLMKEKVGTELDEKVFRAFVTTLGEV
jgi:putative nucleotidyltransferase with HDIG domain